MAETEHYARALVAMVRGGSAPAQAVRALGVYLEARGRAGMIRNLKAKLTQKGIADARREQTVLEVAREKDSARAKSEVSRLIGSLTVNTVREDENIIGGWRLVTHNALVDNSFKRHLLDFYKQITR